MREERALVRAFLACTLDPAAFDHEAHLHVAWWFLRRGPHGGGAARFDRALRRFVSAAGVPEKYHATITGAYLRLLAARLADTPDEAHWPGFLARHPDLRERALLLRYYPRALLDSRLARREFVPAPRPIGSRRSAGIREHAPLTLRHRPTAPTPQ
jgi:hypothetical protein